MPRPDAAVIAIGVQAVNGAASVVTKKVRPQLYGAMEKMIVSVVAPPK